MDLRGRFRVLKAALVKRLGLLTSASCGVERMARRHSQSRLQIVRLYSRRSHHLGKRCVGRGPDRRTGSRGDREYGSMACVCSRRGGKFKKSDFGAPKKRERAAGDLERTKLVLRSLRAQVLLRRAYTSEPLVRNQIRLQISLFRRHRRCLLGAPTRQNRSPWRNE